MKFSSNRKKISLLFLHYSNENNIYFITEKKTICSSDYCYRNVLCKLYFVTVTHNFH